MCVDIERGMLNLTLPCHGRRIPASAAVHYDRAVYDRNLYKTAKTVIHMLVDIVSKNGNLLSTFPSAATAPSTTRKSASSKASLPGWM